MKSNKLVKNSFGDTIFDILNYVFLILAFGIVAYPLIYVVSASFSAPEAVSTGKVWLLPINPTVMAYEAVFKNKQLMVGFGNSFFYMITGTLINVSMTILAAYPLSRKEFKGKAFVTTLFVFTMYFSGGLIPAYMLINNLGLINTRWALILPGAVSVYNLIICRTYMQTNIPDALFDAASIDGCGEIHFMFKMVIPLSGPIIAVLALWFGVGHWNSYFNAMIYLNDSELFPLQLVLRQILILGNIDPTMIRDFEALEQLRGLSDLLKYAVIVVSTVPVLSIYPFVQKYFVKGVMVGSIKG